MDSLRAAGGAGQAPRRRGGSRAAPWTRPAGAAEVVGCVLMPCVGVLWGRKAVGTILVAGRTLLIAPHHLAPPFDFSRSPHCAPTPVTAPPPRTGPLTRGPRRTRFELSFSNFFPKHTSGGGGHRWSGRPETPSGAARRGGRNGAAPTGAGGGARRRGGRHARLTGAFIRANWGAPLCPLGEGTVAGVATGVEARRWRRGGSPSLAPNKLTAS